MNFDDLKPNITSHISFNNFEDTIKIMKHILKLLFVDVDI